MRLYSRIGATAVDDGDEHYAAADDGGFDFPEDVGARLHSFHAAGKALWEDSIERQARMMREEAARRADPATLLAAVEQLVAAAAASSKPEPAPVKPAPKTVPAKAPAAPAAVK
jgi:hypothetical protein